MNQSIDFPVALDVTVNAAGKYTCLGQPALPSTSYSIEEELNYWAADGEIVELIGMDWELNFHSAATPLLVAYLCLIACDTQPNMAIMSTNKELDGALKDMLTEEFAYHILSKTAHPIFYDGSKLFYQSKGSFKVPASWKKLGIGVSDEHQEASGIRTWLSVVTSTASQFTNPSTVSCWGRFCFRTTRTEYIHSPSRLLEGIE